MSSKELSYALHGPLKTVRMTPLATSHAGKNHYKKIGPAFNVKGNKSFENGSKLLEIYPDESQKGLLRENTL